LKITTQRKLPSPSSMALMQKKNNNNCHSLFWWFCCKKGDGNNVITYFYGGVVVKKVMVTSFHRLFLWPFWSSSLKLNINNEMVVFFNVENWND